MTGTPYEVDFVGKGYDVVEELLVVRSRDDSKRMDVYQGDFAGDYNQRNQLQKITKIN